MTQPTQHSTDVTAPEKSSVDDPATDAKSSLYERLGGYDIIYIFAAEALKKAISHPNIGHS